MVRFGFALALVQIVFVCLVQGDLSPRAYRNLYQWDSVHYGHLAEGGYFNRLPPLVGGTDPSRAHFLRDTNVAFFPGYVLAGRAVKTVTGLSTRASLLLASALAAWAFWSTLLLLLARWKIPRGASAAAVLAILVHPAAFFLVAAYSESLFLFGLLGLLLWSEGSSVASGFAAAAHGFVMSLTRIFGLPASVYPLAVAAAETPRHASRIVRAALIALGSALGSIVFFAYSSVVLGKWDLYMRVQMKNWGLRPDYLFPFRTPAMLFAPWLPRVLADDAPSRLVTALTLWLLAACIFLSIRLRLRGRDDPRRWGLLACAVVTWYFPAAALANDGFKSMVRYAFVPYILIVLALALLARTHRRALMLLLPVFLVFAVVQAFLIRMFTAGLWVA